MRPMKLRERCWCEQLATLARPSKGQAAGKHPRGDGPLHNGLGVTPAAALRLAWRHARPIRQMSLRQKSGFSLITN